VGAQSPKTHGFTLGRQGWADLEVHTGACSDFKEMGTSPKYAISSTSETIASQTIAGHL
jgi:hypothetical protein